jgi:uncharacterized protein
MSLSGFIKFMITIIIICSIGIIAYVRYLESISVFYPSREIEATPAELGLAYEEVYINTKDFVTLHGWLIHARPNASQLSSYNANLIFLHGNAGNIGDRLGKIELFHQLGLNILIIDYRGYGKSTGRPSEKGMYNDALAAYDYLVKRPDIAARPIVAYGASLGGAAAIDLATKRSLSHLIIDSSFSSAADMAKIIYPSIPSFLIKTKLDSITKVQKVLIPKLFFHSSEDEVVPIALGEKLYDASPEPKEFVKISGSHNDGHIHSEKLVFQAITRFLNK